MHYMRLDDDSFQAIKEGWKTIEMRLNDEKRSLIKEGDIIVFSNIKTQEEIECKVIKIYQYPDFEELYQHHSKLSIGYKENENADPKDMLHYYSTDNIKKYGVLGIEIVLM